MTFCLMRLSFGSTFVIVTTVLMVIVDMLALMILFSISLNAVSLVNLVMVRFCLVHVCISVSVYRISPNFSSLFFVILSQMSKRALISDKTGQALIICQLL